MRDVFICDAIRTPIGRFGGAGVEQLVDVLPRHHSNFMPLVTSAHRASSSIWRLCRSAALPLHTT